MTEIDPKSHSHAPLPSSSSFSSGVPTEINYIHSKNYGMNNFSGHRVYYLNPPDAVNLDAATLKDQWRFAIRQYRRWYSHAWGTTSLAGAAFFAVGWVIKGENPLPFFRFEEISPPASTNSEKARW